MTIEGALRSFWLALATILLLGCGSENRLNRVPLQGKVSLDNAPLDFGSITFSPMSGQPTSSGGVIIKGEYRIPDERGLPPGKYLVRINASTIAPDSNEAMDVTVPGPPAIERIAPAYNTKSKLIVEVMAEQEAKFDFETTSVQQ